MDYFSLTVRFLLLATLAIFSARSHAFVMNIDLANYNKATGSVSGPVAPAAAGAFSTPGNVSVGGRSVAVQATSVIATSAANVALAAVRVQPGLITGTIAAWLLMRGLDYAVDHWLFHPPSYTPSSPDGYEYKPLYANAPLVWFRTPTEMAQYTWDNFTHLQGCCTSARLNSISGCGWTGSLMNCKLNSSAGTYDANGGRRVYVPACLANETLTNGQCVPNPVPATDNNFSDAATQPITDAAATDLAHQNQPVPVEKPSFAPVDVALGQPYLDPVSNRMVQDRVRIEQIDKTGDPTLTKVTPYRVDAGNVPGQTTAPAVLPEATKDETIVNTASGQNGQTDPAKQQTDCDKLPNSLGCLDVGDAPTEESLQNQSVQFNVSPVSIGTGQCHADIPIVTSHGSYVLSFKPFCDAAGWLKPVILALAWFVAAGIVAGAIKE